MSVPRATMGILEHRGVHLHPLCRDPQEPGRSHIPGQIRQPRPVDTGTDSGKGWDHTLRVFWGFFVLEEVWKFGIQPSQDSPINVGSGGGGRRIPAVMGWEGKIPHCRVGKEQRVKLKELQGSW